MSCLRLIVILYAVLLSGCADHMWKSPKQKGEISVWLGCPPGLHLRDGGYLRLPPAQEYFDNLLHSEVSSRNHQFGKLDAEIKSILKGSIADWAVFGDSLFVVRSNGVLSKYDMGRLGKSSWSVDFSRFIVMPRFMHIAYISSKNLVVLNNGYDGIYGVDATTGKILWNRSLRSPLHERVMVKDDLLIFSTLDNYLHVVDSSNGQLIWGYSGDIVPVKYPARGNSILVAAEVVYFASQGGYVYALDLVLGQLMWSAKLDRVDVNSPVKLATNMVVFDDRLIVSIADGYSYALDINSGKRIWRFECSDIVDNKVMGNKLFLLNSAGKVDFLSIRDGKKLWSWDISEAYKGSSVLGTMFFDSIFWIVGSKGNFLGIDLSSGRCVRRWRPADSLTQLPVIILGRMYLYDGSTIYVAE